MSTAPASTVHDWHIDEREYARHEQRRGRRHAYETLDPERTALVLVVGTAALVTFIGAGGLGGALTSGINLFRFPVMVAASLLIALLALLVEWAGRVLELLLRPKGI